ncbi:hypothetical protein ACFQDN_14045 [Pseudomonas asuensis]
MRYQKQAVALVVAWFMVGGFAHLFMASFFVKLVPIDVPYRFAVVCFGGILEMMVAVAVLFKELRRYAGSVLSYVPFLCYLSTSTHGSMQACSQPYPNGLWQPA